MSTPTVVLLLSAVAAMAADTQDAGTVPTARDLESKVLDNRRALERGHVVVKVRYLRNPSNPKYETLTRVFDMHFDGDKVRSVVEWRHPDWKKTTRAIADGSSFISDWWDKSPVLIGERKKILLGTENLFDPRVLGLSTVSVDVLSNVHRLSDCLWYSGSERTRVTLDTVDGRSAWRVDYQTTPMQRVRLWVVPEFGYGAARIEVENDDIPNMVSVSSEYRRYSDKWFPQRVVYRSSSRGKVGNEEVAEVEEAEFGNAIDPGMFRLEKLGLAPGRELLGTDHRLMIWTGNRLSSPHSPRSPEGATASAEPAGGRSGLMVFRLMSAVVCASAAVVLAVRWFRKRSSDAP